LAFTNKYFDNKDHVEESKAYFNGELGVFGKNLGKEYMNKQ